MTSAGGNPAVRPLYTPEERARRDATPWTLVQGILAPVQFLIFGVSLYLVINYIRTGEHYDWAVWSVVVKTIALYTIMITGAIWEKKVFGVYLFHESFFWEDVFSGLVITLHTLYLIGLFSGIASPELLMNTALAAYVAYVINAVQFILKLRQARLTSDAALAARRGDEPAEPPADEPVAPAATTVTNLAASTAGLAAVVAA